MLGSTDISEIGQTVTGAIVNLGNNQLRGWTELARAASNRAPLQVNVTGCTELLAFYCFISEGKSYNVPGGVVYIAEAIAAAGSYPIGGIYFGHQQQSSQSANSGQYICRSYTGGNIMTFEWVGSYTMDDLRGVVFGR